MEKSAPSPKNVAIFTTFSDFQKAYSLNIVVQDQLKMLTRNGYKPILIVMGSFEAPGDTMYHHEDVTIRTIPVVPVHNQVKKDESFDEDVDAIYQSLSSALEGVDVCITHDIIYQNAALKHNFAARRFAQDNDQIRWLHWIHSATSPVTLNNLRPYFNDEYLNLVRKEFPNSYYVFFNDYSKPRIAENFGINQELVKTVHHPTDICDFLGISPEVEAVVDRKNMLSADAMCTYPIRLDRGKQVEYVIKTMAQLKEFDMDVRVVIIDFHSTGGDKVTYRDNLKQIAIDWGLNPQEITFTSEASEAWEHEVPRHVVRDFMLLSNVFIMPSVSESYSLITQEAGIVKSVVVLNQDFPPFRDIFGSNAIFRKYSSNIDVMTGMDGNTNTDYGPDNVSPEERGAHEKRYHHETAGMIASKLRDSGPMEMSRHLIKNRNLDTVFKNELEPLLYA